VVRIAGVAGAVTDIRARVTVLRDLEGNVHYVPNGLIEVTSNLTQEFAQVVLDVGVAYKESVDRVMEVITDELAVLQQSEEWGSRLLEDPQMLGVDALEDSAVTIRAILKVGADDRWLVKREALRRIKNRMDAEGIEIPFPHMTVYRGDIG
jgi:small conductance mechanosensitive channel